MLSLMMRCGGIPCLHQKAVYLAGGVYADGYGEGFYKLPYQPGDILYVRETWCKGSWMNEKERYYYKADDNDFHCVWHPSIHMPKEAARIWLKVTDVRVERLL